VFGAPLDSVSGPEEVLESSAGTQTGVLGAAVRPCLERNLKPLRQMRTGKAIGNDKWANDEADNMRS